MHAGDGQRLIDTRMVAAVRCAPPDNKPTITERDTCAPWLVREVSLVAPHVRAVVCLGSYGWDAALRTFRALGYDVPRPKPRFGHAAEATLTAPDGRQVCARLLPPVAAEHLHRQADRADARRRARPGGALAAARVEG